MRRPAVRYPLRVVPAVVLALSALVLAIGAATLRYVERQLVADAGQSLALAAVAIGEKLDLLMAERYGDIQMIAHSKTFQAHDPAAMTQYLEWMAAAYPVYESLRIADAAGRTVAGTDPANMEPHIGDHAGQPHAAIRGSDAGSVSVGPPSAGAVILTAPIHGAEGALIGSVIATVALPVLEDAFVHTVTALQAQWGTGVRIEYQFVTREGSVITDSHLREEGRINLRQMGLPSAQLFEAAPPGFVQERHVRRNVDVITGYAMTKGIDGFPALRWGILVRVDQDDILAPIRGVVRNITVGGALMFLPLLGVLWWTTGRLDRAWAAADEERMRATAAEAKFENLVESAPDAIVITDAQGRIVLVNRQAEQLFGYAAEEVCGKAVEILVPERFREGHHGHCARFTAMPAARPMGGNLDLAGRRRDGAEFPMQVSLSHVDSGEGRFVIAAVRDVTRQQAQAAELRAAKEAAEASANAKGEFLATMSHEIRTPMNGVIGTTGLLLDTALTAEQREYVEMIRYSGETLLDIVNDILDFSKIEARKLDLETLDFDLRSMVEDTVSMQAPRAQIKGLELACLIYGTVPSAVRGDPGRLRQILTNLIGNAIKFTERGEVALTVSVEGPAETLRRPTVDIRFEVADTGIGMTADQCAKLFQPFVQGDGSTTRKYGGTGLGLAICKQLVELMQGHIGVDSVPGTGSRFWFTVRLARQPENDPPPQPSGVVPMPLSGRKALIVDDHAINRKILEHQLGAHGLLCESVDQGALALDVLGRAAAAGRPFDLAVVDMHMPRMDGLELARRITGDPTISAVRIVLLTSLGRRGDAKAAQEAGVAAYLTKPIRRPQLLDCVGMVLHGKEPSELPAEGSGIITRHSLFAAEAANGGRVLVVDDNPINQKVAAKMLEKLGCRVDVAANGREAVESVARLPYAIIFMDCQMPEMDGFEATIAIRKREPPGSRIPIVAMTAGAMAEDHERCLAAGMDDYLCKPVQRQDLDAIVRRWLPGGERRGHSPAPASSAV